MFYNGRKLLAKRWISLVRRLPTPYSYSQAVAAGDYVFLGLQRGFGATFTEQLRSALDGLTDTLARIGTSPDQVVKLHVYLKHIRDLPEMEKTMASYFSDGAYPARMTTTTEFIDSDCLLMMDGVAYTGIA